MKTNNESKTPSAKSQTTGGNKTSSAPTSDKNPGTDLKSDIVRSADIKSGNISSPETGVERRSPFVGGLGERVRNNTNLW